MGILQPSRILIPSSLQLSEVFHNLHMSSNMDSQIALSALNCSSSHKKDRTSGLKIPAKKSELKEIPTMQVTAYIRQENRQNLSHSQYEHFVSYVVMKIVMINSDLLGNQTQNPQSYQDDYFQHRFTFISMVQYFLYQNVDSRRAGTFSFNTASSFLA